MIAKNLLDEVLNKDVVLANDLVKDVIPNAEYMCAEGRFTEVFYPVYIDEKDIEDGFHYIHSKIDEKLYESILINSMEELERFHSEKRKDVQLTLF